MVVICTTARNTKKLSGTITAAKAASSVSVADKPVSEPLVEPRVQRREQVGGHRGDHDENEVAAQEVGAERQWR